MKIIFDISHPKLKKFLIHKMNKKFTNIQSISYKQLSEADYIFKYIQGKKDLQQFKDYPIAHHTLIPIIQTPEYMFTLLEYYPLCYIRVDHLNQDINTCLSFIDSIYHEEYTLINFKINHSYIQIKSSSIYSIESFGHYLMIYSESGEYQVRDKLSRVKEILEQYSFIQIHRSYLVNKNFIKKANSQEVILCNSAHIPIGEKYKLNILELIS